ncbi:lactonase family protein [Saccharopolyspora sp. NPDC047091]|uniref:lactonase family protein n=1 Tax=Saccharopolyspora sp. NPDC047091 TaxID=3155924 RepID=UPI0033F31B09
MSVDAQYRVYLGAYTGSDSGANGIRLAFADEAGRLRCTDTVADAYDPSFLALSPDGGTLFAVNEVARGRVVAFQVGADGGLTEINSQPTHGSAPCHLSVHPGGRFLLTANYLSGNVVVHPIGEGGVLREACHAVDHSGQGPDKDRQEGPHAHQIVPSPDGRFALAADLGTDSVYVYAFDGDTGHLALKHEVGWAPGTGPRHLAFHPDGDRGYLVGELTSTITEFAFDAGSGEVRPGRVLPLLPADFTGRSLAAEVVVSPDGRFVFASNRGHDSIAVFAAEGFAQLGVVPAGVRGPRHIALSPRGDVLYAAGELSDTVQAFAVAADGGLTPVGDPVPSPSPVCLLPA